LINARASNLISPIRCSILGIEWAVMTAIKDIKANTYPIIFSLYPWPAILFGNKINAEKNVTIASKVTRYTPNNDKPLRDTSAGVSISIDSVDFGGSLGTHNSNIAKNTHANK
ncbi:hypothetical protein, partial [Shigella sp. FJ200920]|uniref:hypothetical protein n=1 Tax=Shigella sp. FJ200920 TaxID=3156204 RepID=UPI0033990B89